MSPTITDLFCGAGGSGLGAAAAGYRLVMAANHWQLAIETHAANFPDADHDCADISQVDPRRYAATDVLWASPECTNHSQAKGKRRGDYRVLGNRREKVRQLGNGVTPPAAEFILRAVAASLDGAA